MISYFIVMYKGRYGIIYEMPNAKPVSSMIEFQKWKLDSYAKEMGKTLRLIHSCEPDINVMPKTSETFTKYAAAMRNFYNDEEFANRAEELGISIKITDDASKLKIVGNCVRGEVSTKGTFETKRRRIYGTTNGYQLVELLGSETKSSILLNFW